MKFRQGFALRQIGTENVIVPEGIEVIDFNKLISLNESAVYLWTSLQGKTFDAEDGAQLLMNKYDVDIDTARADVKELFTQWKETGLIIAE